MVKFLLRVVINQIGKLILSLALADLVVLAGAVLLQAGEWHTGSSLVCSECHIIHYGEGKKGEPGGPFPYLISHSTINGLCLSCHDGRDASAPDVFSPVAMYDASGDEHSAAGFFTSIGTPCDSAHNLGVMNLVPLRSPPTSLVLNCATCHDVHGNNNYRNLIPDPDSSGSGTNLILGIDMFEGISPAVPPTPEGSISAYKESNVGYRSKLSSWCTECHNDLANNEYGVSPAHFKRHPSELSLNVSPGHTASYHWTSGDGWGFGSMTGDATEGVPRVRFQEATAVDFNSAKAVGPANQVFCGSCHLAHGWNYSSCAIWPYKQVSADMYSPCQQCHNQ